MISDLTEQSKSDREKTNKYRISLTCQILKNGTNELIYKTETVTEVENKLWLPRGKRVGEIGRLGLT